MCLAILLVLAAGTASADTKSFFDPGLFFGLGQDTTFIRRSTDSTSLETARIAFSLTFGMNGEPIPEGNLTGADFEFTFDPQMLTFTGADPVGDWTVQATPIESGRVRIQIFGDVIEPPRDDPTALAELKFYAWCQPEKSENPVTLDRTRTSATLTDSTGVSSPYTGDIWQDGTVHIADYIGDFTIDNVNVSPGDTTGYDREVTVAVNATTNFRIQNLQHEIEYDSTRLEFIGIDPGDVEWQDFIDPPSHGDYPVLVTLAADYYVGAGPFYTPTALYYLRFRIKPDIKWDGQTTTIRFGGHSQVCMHGGSGFACPEALADDPPVTYSPGSVTLELYSAKFKAVPIRSGIRFDGDNWVSYSIQLENHFYTGMPADSAQYRGNIFFALDLNDNVDTVRKVETDPDLHFVMSTVQKSYAGPVHIYQMWDPVRTNFWPPQDELREAVQLDMKYAGALPTLYSQRFITPFSFIGVDSSGLHVDTTRVTDLYGYVQADSTNGRLTCEVEPVEVPMGEFNVSGGWTKFGTEITGYLKIRHNVELSDLYAALVLSPEYRIVGYTLAEGVSGFWHDCGFGQTCLTLRQESGAEFPATGDDWVTIATITYTPAYGCTAGSRVVGSIQIGGRSMYDMGGNFLHVVTNRSASLSALCPGDDGPVIDPDTVPHDHIERKPDNGLPTAFTLHANYPNPFNPATQIKFDLPNACHVTLDVFNIAGQRITTLVDRTYEAGFHTVEWNGKTAQGQPVASGVYFYRLTAGDFVSTRKMMLLK